MPMASAFENSLPNLLTRDLEPGKWVLGIFMLKLFQSFQVEIRLLVGFEHISEVLAFGNWIYNELECIQKTRFFDRTARINLDSLCCVVGFPLLGHCYDRALASEAIWQVVRVCCLIPDLMRQKPKPRRVASII
jgi:hypothetical protein